VARGEVVIVEGTWILKAHQCGIDNSGFRWAALTEIQLGQVGHPHSRFILPSIGRRPGPRRPCAGCICPKTLAGARPVVSPARGTIEHDERLLATAHLSLPQD